jgi:hypothetical protein
MVPKLPHRGSKHTNGTKDSLRVQRSLSEDMCGGSRPYSWKLNSRIFIFVITPFSSSIIHGISPKTYLYFEKNSNVSKVPPMEA